MPSPVKVDAQRARLAEEHESIGDLLLREEDLAALIDTAFQQACAAHAARAHAAAEVEVHPALQRIIENGSAAVRRKAEAFARPLAHLDPFGTVLILFAGFGWAKPVPFDPNNLRFGPRIGTALVAVAGRSSARDGAVDDGGDPASWRL